MSGEIWLLFAVTETVLCFTPGPAVLLVLSQGLARGTASSIWANLGILAGNTLYFVLSATSLGALLVAMMIARPQGLLGEKRVEII